MNVIFLPEAQRFMSDIEEKARLKIYQNISAVCQGLRDPRLFKKLENANIWEFRTEYSGNAYRLFSFWDTRTDTLVVATHGIIKKTQKTPKKEIEKAEKIRKAYFNS